MVLIKFTLDNDLFSRICSYRNDPERFMQREDCADIVNDIRDISLAINNGIAIPLITSGILDEIERWKKVIERRERCKESEIA